jgi:hypothetical protein
MNQDEVMELAKQCSFTPHWEYEKCLSCNPDSLLHFAKLVAKEERESIVKIIKDTPFSNWFQADVIATIRKKEQA